MSNSLPLCIFYGSETGNSEELARQIALEGIERIPSNYISQEIKDKGLKLLALDEFENWIKDQGNESRLAIIICSSTGDGEPPENSIKFDNFLDRNLGKNMFEAFKSLSFCLLGMGDSTYDLTFGQFPRKVYNSLLKFGAKSLIPFAITDDDKGIEIVFDEWNIKLWKTISLYLNKGFNLDKIEYTSKEIPLDVVIDELKKENHEENGSITNITHEVLEEDSNATLPLNYSQSLHIDYEAIDSLIEITGIPKTPVAVCTINPQVSEKGINSNNKIQQGIPKFLKEMHPSIFQGKIVKVTSISSYSAVKRTLKVQVEIPQDSVYYVPGDAFAVFVPNDETLINKLINRLGLEGKDDRIILSAKAGQLPSHLLPFTKISTTISEILTHTVDLLTLPKKALFKVLSEYCSDPQQKRQLEVLCSKQGTAIFNALRNQSPTLLDILNAFPASFPPIERLLDVLPALQPRYYSVTTSPLTSPHKVEFIFNVVQYYTESYSHLRHGLVTPYIDRQSGLIQPFTSSDNISIPIPMFLKPHSTNSFHLPSNSKLPLILVGPGTGLAPLLSFLRHRQAQRQMVIKAGTIGRSITEELKNRFGKIWLIFGTRDSKKDFFENKILFDMVKDGTIDKLDVVFSREIEQSFTFQNGKEEKVLTNGKYVQDILTNNSKEIFEFLNNNKAHFYLCGDASKMAKDVNTTLTEIILKYGDQFDNPITNIKEAQAQMLNWGKDGRIKRDLW